MTALQSPFTPGFTAANADDLAATLKALASPARLRILALLSTGGLWTGVQIEHALKDLAQPTLAHHLRVLDAAGMITTHRESVYAYRKVATDRLHAIARLLHPGGAR